jgi:hypothetical protein
MKGLSVSSLLVQEAPEPEREGVFAIKKLKLLSFDRHALIGRGEPRTIHSGRQTDS